MQPARQAFPYNDEIDARRNESSGEHRVLVISAVRKASVDNEVVAFEIAEFAQLRLESLDWWKRAVCKKSEPPAPPGLLRGSR